MVDMVTLRPNHIEDALAKLHNGQWFTWTDSKNKIYANLRLAEKIGVNGNLVDNTVTELPTESAVNAKLKELQDAWDAANGGQMAYIGQGIKEGTFAVLDTSGNTYNGSNVTFSLGTQVGSPAQLLVSHDGVIQKPGTDYSLATGGTQITFSTAPASGASIFIVEISGAVGGPLESDLNGAELILDADADTSITADTDDQIDIKIANTDHIKIATSSGDTVIQPMTDAKDIIIKQYDGTELVNFNDGAYSSFTSAALNPEATLSDGATPAWNALTEPVAKITIAGNRTIGAASGGVAGQFISLLIIQDGTGSRTMTWNAAYEFKDDTAPTLTTTASKGDLFVFRYNGSKWLEVGRNQNLTLSQE